MPTRGELRIEPSPEILSATRRWVDAVRPALGSELLAAYLSGSALTQGFDPRQSRINLLVVARALAVPTLERLRQAIPVSKKPPHFDPLFLTGGQIEKSLDSFPIEWLEIQERNLLIEGEDVLRPLEVPRTYVRLQCEHELRGKHIQLRQAYLLLGQDAAELDRVLKATASSFATLFRTLLRLRGEPPPAETPQVIERVADIYGVDAQGLLSAHLARYSGRPHTAETDASFRRFLTEVDRLVIAIDELRVS